MDPDEIISDSEQESLAGVRLVVLNLPEDEGEGLGFRLTRTLWDPYPWIHEVTPESRADTAGLRAGDCLLQADGRDLLGLSIGKVAGLIRGDGEGHGVSLLVWNCGVDPRDDPELLWSCGGGSRGEKSRRALAGVVKALSCCVCAATATKALNCARSHLYCEGCWSRLERCALCRETLPAKDSPYARNLVAEQVFEAIATEYEIKYSLKRPQSISAHTSPNVSPTARRKGQYQLSLMHRNRKPTQYNEKFASDPNINHSKPTISGNTELYSRKCNCQTHDNVNSLPESTISTKIASDPNINNSKPTISTTNSGSTESYSRKCNCQMQDNVNVLLESTISTKMVENSNNSNILTEKCNCKGQDRLNIPQINIEDTSQSCGCGCQQLQHKLVARIRHACSLADLQNVALQSCSMSKSMNNISQHEQSSSEEHQNNSLDNLKNMDTPVFLLSTPPIYLLTCGHSK